mgnify:FL=1
MEYRGLTLDVFQEKAFRAIDRGENVFVAAPTGAGKTLIADYAIDQAMRSRKRIVYTAPIKALSNQKYRDFGVAYPGSVGIMTGDVTLSPGAPILIMTTEIFRNSILETPERYEDVHYLIFDEVHFLRDIERGTVWEESIIFAPPPIRILALSATVPNLNEICKWVQDVRGQAVQQIREYARPVPLEPWVHTRRTGVVPFGQLSKRVFQTRPDQPWTGPDHPHSEVIDHVVEKGWLPCLYFAFSRRSCEELAWLHRQRELLDSDATLQAAAYLDELSAAFQTNLDPGDHALGSLLVRGIAYHHAGMLPTHKEIVERFFTRGLIKLLFATETFAMGINMPARSVIFDDLRKFDGQNFRNMSPLEWQQMAGRAGRRGMDEVGFVLSCLNPQRMSFKDVGHTIEGDVERIESQFNLGYSTILSLFGRHGLGVYRAADQSFAAFQKAWDEGKFGGRRHAILEHIRFQLKKKLELLDEFGYLDLDREKLTDKGKFASVVQGYELQIAELMFAGVFEELSKDGINVLVSAIVYEGDNRTWYDARLTKRLLAPMKKGVKNVLKPLFDATKRLKIRDDVKPPDFRLAAAVHAFSTGESFTELEHYTDAGDGDLIRALRSTIQVLRQIKKAAAGYDEFVERVDQALASIDRGEVDAAKQLRVGQEIDLRAAMDARKTTPVE